MSNYIEKNKKDWGQEFAAISDIEYLPVYDEIDAMGCYTVMYHIADNFEGGKYRAEILKLCGVDES